MFPYPFTPIEPRYCRFFSVKGTQVICKIASITRLESTDAYHTTVVLDDGERFEVKKPAAQLAKALLDAKFKD